MKQRGYEMKQRIYDSIVDYAKKHGYYPTIREIGKMTGLKSTSSVYAYMDTLFEEGKLQTDHYGMSANRAYRATEYEIRPVSEKNHIELPVEGKGVFKVDVSKDPERPGIDIEFIPDNTDETAVSNPRILFEFNKEMIHALGWTDSKIEDPKVDIRFQ